MNNDNAIREKAKSAWAEWRDDEDANPDQICGKWMWIEGFVSGAKSKAPEKLVVELLKLRAQVDELANWKRQQLEVESKWDAQKVASLLGIGLGEDIRPNIQPKIEALIARVAELEKDKERLDWLVNEVGDVRQATDTTINFFQDDATSMYFVNKHWGPTLRSAIDAAKGGV